MIWFIAILVWNHAQLHCESPSFQRESGLATSWAVWRSSFCPGGPSSSAKVRRLVIHDIKEVESVGQQEEQEDKRDEEIGDEVNGEVEEVTQRAHETWR